MADQTVSQKSLTGFRLALTEVSRSGTELVRSATARTPPVVATRFARIALKWRMTRSKATAVSAMITAEMISVTQAAPGMSASFLRRLPEYLCDRAGVPHSANRHLLDRFVGCGQCGRDVGQLAYELHAAAENVVSCVTNPLDRCKHAIEHEEHDSTDDEQQDRVTDPPQGHGLISSARVLVRKEEAPEDPAQRH